MKTYNWECRIDMDFIGSSRLLAAATSSMSRDSVTDRQLKDTFRDPTH